MLIYIHRNKTMCNTLALGTNNHRVLLKRGNQWDSEKKAQELKYHLQSHWVG